jgi:hypothetical protein
MPYLVLEFGENSQLAGHHDDAEPTTGASLDHAQPDRRTSNVGAERPQPAGTRRHLISEPGAAIC